MIKEDIGDVGRETQSVAGREGQVDQSGSQA